MYCSLRSRKPGGWAAPIHEGGNNPGSEPGKRQAEGDSGIIEVRLTYFDRARRETATPAGDVGAPSGSASAQADRAGLSVSHGSKGATAADADPSADAPLSSVPLLEWMGPAEAGADEATAPDPVAEPHAPIDEGGTGRYTRQAFRALPEAAQRDVYYNAPQRLPENFNPAEYGTAFH